MTPANKPNAIAIFGSRGINISCITCNNIMVVCNQITNPIVSLKAPMPPNIFPI